MRRNEIDAGSQPVRNLLTNPAFETASAAKDLTIRTNHLYNPAMRSISATPTTLRTNLISNSSMEASGGSVAVRTNLITNPGVATTTGSGISVRTNLVSSARGVSALSQYNGTGTVTPNVSISGHPEGITTALRIAYTTQANPGVSLIDVAESGVTYSISAWVYHESVMSTTGTQGLAQAGVTSQTPAAPTIVTGTWQKITWIYTTTSTSNIGFRVTGASGTGTGSYLITGMMIEKTGTIGSFFDGSTTSLNRCPNPSFETDFSGWASQWYGSGGGAGTTARSPGTGMAGGASVRKTWTTANTTNAVDVGIVTTLPVTPGQTYTSSIYQRSSIANSLSVWMVWRDASNAVISTSNKSTVTSPAGAYVRGYATETAPANAAFASFVFGPYTNAVPIPQGAYIDWDWCLIEEGGKLNPYYDGTAAAPDDFTYNWLGTPYNSSSVQRAPQPALYAANNVSSKVWQSSAMSHNGSKSLAVESTGTDGYNGVIFTATSLPIGTYTVSGYVYLPAAYGTGVAAQAQGAGATLARGNPITATGSWQRTKLTFTTTSVGNVSLYFITDNGVAATVGSKFWVDSVMLEAVPDVSPYFDAANPRTNLISNPSFEVNTTGWAGAGGPPSGVVSRDASPVYAGTGSLKVVCDGTVVSQGAFTSVRPSVKPNRYYTASVWIKSDAAKLVRIELGEWDEGNNLVGSRSSGGSVAGTGDWIRLSVTRLMSAAAASVDIVIRNVNGVAHTFWIDAALLEESDVLNDYYEGTGPFTYVWSGTANASTSEQRATSVSGITWTGTLSPYQSTARSFTGSKSLYVEGNPSDTIYQVTAGPTVSGLTVGTSYTVSAWVFVVPGSVGLELQPSGVGSVPSGRTAYTGKWERVYQTFAAASTSHTLRLRTTANGKVQAYIDAMTLEQGVSTNLPYFDGATPAYENLTTGTPITALAGVTVTTGVSYSGMIWSRATAVTGTGALIARQSVPLSKLVDQQPYAVSVTVANDSASSVNLSLDWCDSNQVTYTLAPGEVRRLSTAGTRAQGYYDTIYRFADLQITQSPTEQKSVLFKDWLIERGTTINNYYSGSGDFSYAWTGTADASTSIQRTYPTIGTQASKSNTDLSSRFWGYSSTDETGAKVAKWVAPAGTPNSTWRVAGLSSMDYANIQVAKQYTLYLKFRASGWPAGSLVNVQLSDGSGTNLVMSIDASYRLDLNASGWQTYRRTFTANMTALTTTWVYISLPQTPDTVTDGVFEISEAFLVDNSHSGAYFDGSTVSTDPDFFYAWNGAPDASTSKMLGASVTGTDNLITHGQGVVSTEWKSSGAKSMRLLAKNVTSNDSFVDIKPMLGAGGVLKPYTKYTIAGTRFLKAPLTGTLSTSSPGFRVNVGGDRTITYKPGYGVVNTAGANRVVANFTTADTGAASFIRLQQGSMEGNGDVWWDDIMLVEGDYDGRHIDGTKLNAKWEGTTHASTSVGYPTTLEALVGMPLLKLDTAGTFSLNSADLSSTSARTFYSIVDAPVDLPSNMVDLFWIYGKTGFSDAAGSENTTITLRYQSETGNFNSVLARRTGGAGAFKFGVPTPGRYIMTAGLDAQGKLFSGHGGSTTLINDTVAMNVPHESVQIYANNSYHTHIITYMYAGQHDLATRTEVYKLLAQRHNVPLLV